MADASPDPFRERLQEAIGVVSIFAKRSGFPERTLRNWIKGVSRPDVDDLREIAALTRRSVAWLVGESAAPPPPAETTGVVRIPIIDARASAGPGAWNEHAQEIDGVAFPLDWLRRLGGPGVKPAMCDFIRARGDSMVPTIADGALILVDRGDVAPPLWRAKRRAPNDDIFVFDWQDEIRIKRLTRQPGEMLSVVSDNPQHPPEIAPPRSDLTVIGRVIWWDNRL